MAPQFGLLVRYRPYRCDCCGNVHDVQTNHTDACFAPCPKCSWHGAFDSSGRLWNAMEKNRPHVYAGPPVSDNERNPYANRES